MSPTATADPVADVPTVSASIAAKMRALEAESLAQWRKWAREIAAGGKSPDARALLEVAAVLQIRDSGAALEHDADVINELAALEGASKKCAALTKEALVPFGGSIANLQAAKDKADAECLRLREIQSNVDGEFGGWQWSVSAKHMRRENPRLFGKEVNT
jgi:hypothetical protein